MNLKKYAVTDLAGPHVAGFPVPKDKVMELTDEQAYYARLNGEIVPVTISQPPKKK